MKGFAIAAMATSLLASCDNGFEDMNINPNAVVTPVVDNLFSYNITRVGGTGFENHRGNLIYAGAMVQHFASLTTYWSGDKYLYNDQYSGAFFLTAYTDGAQVKEIEQLISLLKDKPDDINKYSIVRIWRVFIYHRITDLYGDVPYSQAGKGYLEGIYNPAYDTQQSIYMDMLKELDEATQALNASGTTFGAADYIYGGDIAKWKKFGYSLMLRLGMRLTKVDASTAETYVKKAISGGVMTSNEDIAKLAHSAGNNNNYNQDSQILTTQEYDATNLKGIANSKLSKTFVDFLKINNDPRLPYIATLWQGNADPAQQVTSTLPAVQKGLPNGYDATTIKTLIPTWNDNTLAEYSEANLNTVGSFTAPTIFQSYAEVELLLAEASLRGWGDGQTASHYNKGVTAAMAMFSLYPNSTALDASAYLTAHPFMAGSIESQMEQIHTQYWAACFLNSYEAYANWRRTGYPVLTPTNYAGNETSGTIPRRLRYPLNEASVNAEQYQKVVQQQGADLLTTRVWWDKQ